MPHERKTRGPPAGGDAEPELIPHGLHGVPSPARVRDLGCIPLAMGSDEYFLLWSCAPEKRRELERLHALTPSERAVAVMVIQGLSTCEIARSRGTTAKTTSNQLAAVYCKLGLRSRRELRTVRGGEWARAALRQPLAEGRWALLDDFESNGQRIVVARRDDARVPVQSLSPRERQVAAYAALGHSNKVIAYQLGLSTSTVSTHLSRAREKLQLLETGGQS